MTLVALSPAISIPGALAALLTGRLNSRIPATLLIAVGGLIPAITSGLNRFGDTESGPQEAGQPVSSG